MQLRELLLEDTDLEQALNQGWVRINYTRLDGVTRILLATRRPDYYKYVFKRPKHAASPRVIVVWERRTGWRALRKNRIVSWRRAD